MNSDVTFDRDNAFAAGRTRTASRRVWMEVQTIGAQSVGARIIDPKFIGLTAIMGVCLFVCLSGGCCHLQVPSYRAIDCMCENGVCQSQIAGTSTATCGSPRAEIVETDESNPFAAPPPPSGHLEKISRLIHPRGSSGKAVKPPAPKFHPLPTRPVFLPAPSPSANDPSRDCQLAPLPMQPELVSPQAVTPQAAPPQAVPRQAVPPQPVPSSPRPVPPPPPKASLTGY